MSDETTQFILGDAAVDAVTGGPRRRRFFGRKKKAKKESEPLAHCENCGTSLTGAYCSGCGQHAIDYRRSIVAVLIDAADSFFNWDTKFLQSVVVLITRPWKLTNDFNAGRRMRYVHPLRLYLLASIAFFLMARLINLNGSSHADFSPKDRAEFQAALGKLTAPDSALSPEQRAKVAEFQKSFAIPDEALNAKNSAALERAAGRLSGLAEKKHFKTKDVDKLDAILNAAAAAVAPPPPEDFIGPPVNGPFLPKAPKAVPTPKKGPIVQFDSEEEKNTPFGKWIEGRVKSKIGEDGTNAQLFLETLRSNVPTMMLCCIPLFAFVLKILYVRQRRFYVEHLVYALHIHTFAYFAAVLVTLIGMGLLRVLPSFQVPLVVLLSCLALILVFTSIRRVYRQGWFMTTYKFLLGGFIYFMILVFAVTATAFVTLLLPS